MWVYVCYRVLSFEKKKKRRDTKKMQENGAKITALGSWLKIKEVVAGAMLRRQPSCLLLLYLNFVLATRPSRQATTAVGSARINDHTLR